jgi:hypothetical protein
MPPQGVSQCDMSTTTPVTWYRLYQGELIQCQNDHGDYVYSFRVVVMSVDDGTDSSTRVPIVSCVWALVITSCHD